MNSHLYAAVDLGGTNIALALGTADGRLVLETKEPTHSHEGPEAVVARIADLIERLMEGRSENLRGVGIGVPGLLDLPAGKTLLLPNLPGPWAGFPLRDQLSARLRVGVALINDARAAALGEARYGVGREGTRSLLIITLGTGVGGGLVLDGRLRLGALGAAGEIGHVSVQPDGPWCGCGSRGCLETLVSGPALTGEAVRLVLSGNAPKLRAICQGELSLITPAAIGQAARDGEPSALALLNRAGLFLGKAAAAAALIAHPEAIVLGGGVSALGELLLAPMRQAFDERVKMLPSSSIAIRLSALGERAGLYGALAAAITPEEVCPSA